MFKKMLPLALALAVVTTACASADTEEATTEETTAVETVEETTTTTEAMEEEMDEAMDLGTIVDVAAGNPDFSTLVAAVQAAGLVDTLSSDGPFTVFAPTNAAFDDALAALGLTADELLADTETLTSILTYHVLAGEVDAATAISLDGQSAETVNGESIRFP